jgi:hypothetical protein
MKKEMISNYLGFLFEHDSGHVKMNEVWQYSYNSFELYRISV